MDIRNRNNIQRLMPSLRKSGSSILINNKAPEQAIQISKRYFHSASILVHLPYTYSLMVSEKFFHGCLLHYPYILVRKKRKGVIFPSITLRFYDYECIRYISLAGKPMVIVVPFEGTEDAEIFRYNLSHRVLHKYNPIPVAFSFFLPLFPVKP